MKIKIPEIITDQFIIQCFYNENTNKIVKIYLKNIPIEIQEYLNNRYSDSSCIKETIYRIVKHIDIHPVCPICGKQLQYYGHSINKIYFNTCGSHECLYILRKQKREQTCLEKYGSINVFGSEYGKEKLKQTWLNNYGTTNPQGNKEIREKSLQTMRKKYNEELDNPFQFTEVKEKIRETKLKLYGDETYTNHDKMIQTCLEKYGVENPSFVKEINDKKRKTFFNNFNTIDKLNELQLKRETTNLIKYGVKCYFLIDDIKKIAHNPESMEKRYITKKKNHTFNSSKIEQQFKKYLEQNYPNDFEYQYRSELYPFNCDFYIKSLDLYIEIQGTWLHGGHPYNNDEKDNNIIKQWQKNKGEQYKAAIHTWTVSDINKRQIAKENNLNYLEIFSYNINECITALKNKIIEINN